MKPSYSTLKSLWPNASEALLRGLLKTWDEMVATADLTTSRRLKHFFGQISEECRGGSVLTENLNYTTPARIKQVWPSRFNLATAAMYIRRPQALANKVYNGRMGNRPNSNDGWDMRGRGVKMITGRDMYEKYGIVDDPDKASDPEYAFILAAKIWRDKRCNEAADRDDVRGVTLKINGGTTNLSNRIEWTKKWERVFAPVAADGSLRLGDEGPKVLIVQQRLKELNYQPGRPDKKFGTETQKAVLDFQARNNLPTTGVVDRRTNDALFDEDAVARVVSEARASATVAELREDGSQTIATADQIKAAGVGLGVLGGANEAGVLEKAKGLLDETSVVREVISTGQEMVMWAMGYWPFWLILAGFLFYRYGHLIQKMRLSSHRKGEDLSR